MSDLLPQVRAGGLLADGRPVVVLLSGGRDSTCLLDLAIRISGVVTAMHVNYGLRAGADADQAHCAALCRALGVRLHTVRAGEPRGNVQAWARKLRYEEAAALHGEIAAGHTATDQVETILYRLASSPSRRALYGMRPRDGRLVRPLLSFTREQTAEHCVGRGLSWVDDESNETDAYARGRIRGALVPALEAAHPAAQANVLALAEVLRAEGELLDALVDAELAAGEEIAVARLRELAPALARLVVQRLADCAVGRPAAGVARRAGEVLALREGGMLDLGAGVRARVQSGALRMGRTPPPDDSARAREARS